MFTRTFCCVVVAACCAGCRWVPPPDDLEGVWRSEESPKHVYRFRGDGVVENSWGGLPFGAAGTRSREGAKVRYASNRDWDFVAELRGDQLTGDMVERSSGRVIGPTKWRRETRDHTLP